MTSSDDERPRGEVEEIDETEPVIEDLREAEELTNDEAEA